MGPLVFCIVPPATSMKVFSENSQILPCEREQKLKYSFKHFSTRTYEHYFLRYAHAYIRIDSAVRI